MEEQDEKPDKACQADWKPDLFPRAGASVYLSPKINGKFGGI